MRKKVFFISDLHLGAAYSDNSRETERRVVRFLDSIKREARELYLLGDILDYWFEYRHVVPRGFVRFFGKLAELSDAGVKITWLIGNHDIWIFDYIPSELGVEVVDGIIEKEILGTKFCMQHGDAVCGDRKFRFLRALFRNKVCQKLYSGIHPRWTVGFAFSCSRRSRLGKRGMAPEDGPLLGEIKEWVKSQISEGNHARYFLFGHLHLSHKEKLGDKSELIVLPDWPSKGGYGTFDGEKFELLNFDFGELKNDEEGH